MFVIPAFLLGCLVGSIRAGKLGGKGLDKLQFAAVYGIIFFLIALTATIFVDWLGWI